MNAPWNLADVGTPMSAEQIHADITAMMAAASYPTCPDCGSAAQGRGFFGKLYCGLCERSIEEVRHG